MQTAARVFKPLATRLAGRGGTHAAGHGGHGAGPSAAAGGGGIGTRGIHVSSSSIPHFVPRPRLTAAHAQRLLQQTRTAVNGLIQQIVGSGAHSSSAAVEHISLARVHARAGRAIQHSLSPGARFVLARPMGSPQLPRLPTVQRGLHEVGLGCARNFSSGRTVFHHVIENTSITTRALWDSDWEKHLKREQVKCTDLRKSKGKENSKRRGKAIAFHPIKNFSPPVVSESVIDDEKDELLAHYFPLVHSEVDTYLQIALAPTPSLRLPHSTISYSETRLLPLRAIFSQHATFQAHSHRVAQIFSKLDEEGIWEKGGVFVEPYGDTAGLCTELRVKFEGWTEEQVRGLLGGLVDGDSDGIAIQEIRESPAASEIPDSLMASLMATPTSLPQIDLEVEIQRPMSILDLNNPWSGDSNSQYIMPTLDITSSFESSLGQNLENSCATSTWDDPQEHFSDIDSTSLSLSEPTNSDGSSDEWNRSMSGGSYVGMDAVPSVNNLLSTSSPSSYSVGGGYRDAVGITDWIAFSSEFTTRVGETNDFHT